jgi:hypothetical protein
VDSSIPIGGAEERPGGSNLQEESDSEQESEPYGGDHSAAIDHFVGSRRHCVGFLLGVCLSPPLALAAGKQNTGELYKPERSLGTAKQYQPGMCGTKNLEFLVKRALRRGSMIHTWLGTLSLRSFPVLV